MKFDISDDTPVGFKSNLFAKLSKEDQIEYMREWFYERYEDPVNRSPYESSEGGYIFIHGGPFDAGEELQRAFSGCAREGVIEELAEELSHECSDWTHTAYSDIAYRDDYDYSADFDDTVQDFEFISRLSVNLDSIARLVASAANVNMQDRRFARMMHFSFCITSLETYLSDVFARAVMKDSKYKSRFLKTDQVLSAKKFPLGDLFERVAEIDDEILKRISAISFHKLPVAKQLFWGVFQVDIEYNNRLVDAVTVRHDFVHRGGKDVDGRIVSTSDDEITGLISLIKTYAIEIDRKLVAGKFLEGSPF